MGFGDGARDRGPAKPPGMGDGAREREPYAPTPVMGFPDMGLGEGARERDRMACSAPWNGEAARWYGSAAGPTGG